MKGAAARAHVETPAERIASHVASFAAPYGLTPREREVVCAFLEENGSVRCIVRRLDMNQYTVISHLRGVYKRCGVTGKTALLTKIYRHAIGVR